MMIFPACRRACALAFLALQLLNLLSPGLQAIDWPVATDGLQPDPRWQWGRLPNGLRYVVRRNALPAGHISYRFAVEDRKSVV